MNNIFLNVTLEKQSRVFEGLVKIFDLEHYVLQRLCNIANSPESRLQKIKKIRNILLETGNYENKPVITISLIFIKTINKDD